MLFLVCESGFFLHLNALLDQLLSALLEPTLGTQFNEPSSAKKVESLPTLRVKLDRAFHDYKILQKRKERLLPQIG
jgi:hypothetical protein